MPVQKVYVLIRNTIQTKRKGRATTFRQDYTRLTKIKQNLPLGLDGSSGTYSFNFIYSVMANYDRSVLCIENISSSEVSSQPDLSLK